MAYYWNGSLYFKAGTEQPFVTPAWISSAPVTLHHSREHLDNDGLSG